MENKEILQEIEKKHAHPPMLPDSMIFEAMEAARQDEREKLSDEKEITEAAHKFAPNHFWKYYIFKQGANYVINKFK